MSYADNKRIAKNTIYLYIRTFVSMIVALYTSRKILEALGVDDFGIFNVVGGIISLMSFINGSMSVATQRYLTYELGRGTEGQFNKVFNMAVYIHAIIAVIVLIAAETMGVWFVNTQLNIPEVRMEAANWVFQATILTTILGILQTPYNAAIISHEHMHIYAYVGLGETLAKLFIVWGLFYYPYDRLAIWGFAIFLLQFLIAMIYRMYCSRQFPECRLHLRWNKAIFNYGPIYGLEYVRNYCMVIKRSRHKHIDEFVWWSCCKRSTGCILPGFGSHTKSYRWVSECRKSTTDQKICSP